MHPWFKTFLAGIGILSDAFNLFSINLVKNVMAIKYPQTQGQTSSISSAALAGAIIGQLTFGSLADRLGRRAIFVSTIAIVIVGALGSATVVESSSINIYTQLTLWLLLLGLGIGGEYPLSASVSSEGSGSTSRGKAVGATFAMQGVGNLLASLTMFILLSSDLDLDWVWRIALGAGAVPGLLTVYFRYRMEESSAFKQVAASNRDAAAARRSHAASLSVASVAASRRGSVATTPLKSRHASVGASPFSPIPAGPLLDVAALDGDRAASTHSLLDNEHSSPARPSVPPKSMAAAGGAAALHAGGAAASGAEPDETTPLGAGDGAGPAESRLTACLAPFQSLLSTIWEFRWLLLGTAGSWLLFDIVFYANGEFSGSVLEDMGWSKSVNKSALAAPASARALGAFADLSGAENGYADDASATHPLAAVASSAAQSLGAAAAAAAGGVMLRGRALLRALSTSLQVGSAASGSASSVAAAAADPLAAVGGAAALLGTTEGLAAAKQALASTALGNLILALIGLPGYVVAVFVIDRLGRRNLQLIGFAAVAVIYVILAAALGPLVSSAPPALLVFYGLSFFFLNVGPNTTTFVIPSEAFPTRAKATCHGISAASGKLGAVIGAAMMSPLLDWYGSNTAEEKQRGLSLVLYACAAVSVVGLIWTFFFTQETGHISIENLDRFGVQSFRMPRTAAGQIQDAPAAAPGSVLDVPETVDDAMYPPTPLMPRRDLHGVGAHATAEELAAALSAASGAAGADDGSLGLITTAEAGRQMFRPQSPGIALQKLH